MMSSSDSRRSFLQTAAAASLAPALFVQTSRADENAKRSANATLQAALIGCGWRPDIKRLGRGHALARQFRSLGHIAAIAEVDQVAMDFASKRYADASTTLVEDYREILDRDDIDAVLIASPDHWHAKMSVDAMRAGKDVYCEKPATVTIAEGRDMSGVAAKTGRILQVGTQQRTEYGKRFAEAVAIVQSGRLGRVHTIRVGVDEGLAGGPFTTSEPPSHLNYDLWQGPAPAHDYITERTHWTFRWWYEYAGGKLTDWGAHHIDIAQWAIGCEQTGPSHIEGSGTFLQPYRNGHPTRTDIYNTPTTFAVTLRFENVSSHGDDDGTVTMFVDSTTNGILFEGDRGRIAVNRGRLTGKPVEDLATNPLPADAIDMAYRRLGHEGSPPTSHMNHFVDCIRGRSTPISDIETHQRTITTCHLANIALRLGRPLRWNPSEERFLADDEANSFVSRTPREGYSYA